MRGPRSEATLGVYNEGGEQVAWFHVRAAVRYDHTENVASVSMEVLYV
jgi:hypothetical protein